MTLHLTPSFANSAAKPLVAEVTAPLEPAYQTRLGRGRAAEIEEILTKTPERWDAKCGWILKGEEERLAVGGFRTGGRKGEGGRTTLALW